MMWITDTLTAGVWLMVDNIIGRDPPKEVLTLQNVVDAVEK